jgi:sec-independent protein translocase protein TatB
MFGDIGWAEMLLIGIVALVVIGPEDLPQMFRQIGRFTAKIRAMSRDFSRAMEQAAKDTGVKDMAKDLRSATSVGGLGLDKVKAAADKFEKWDPIKGNMAKPAAKPLVPAPIPETPKPVVTPEALVTPVTVTTPEAVTTPKPVVTTAASDAQPISAPKRRKTVAEPESSVAVDKVKTARAPRKKKPEANPE